MASMQSIARLYAAEPKGPAKRTAEEIAIEATNEKVPSPVPLPTERLRGFRRSEQASYELTGPEILAIAEPATGLDRGADFESLAMRDQFLKLARARLRAGQRGGAGFRPGPLIQEIQV
jgi:hypothetical protein